MQGVDLSWVQGDFDQTWWVLFLGADGTVYGRYGTRSIASGTRETGDRDVSLAGFVAAMQGALELHGARPASLAALAAKRAPPPRAKTPDAMPCNQGGRFDQPLPRGCIHCHDVARGLREETRPKGKPVPDAWLWRFPMPNALGLVLDRDQRATVAEVTAGSAAARAGLRKGDRIVAFGGAPPISIADVQWALEHAPATGEIAVTVARGAETKALVIPLAAGWRRVEDFTWRESTWPLRPGMRVDAMSDEDRRRLGGGKPVVGLRVRNAWPNQRAAKAGLRNGDEIVSLDGETTPMGERDFLAWLYQSKRAGDDVAVVVARGDKRVTLHLPVP